MTLFFSPSTGGFYDDAIHGPRHHALPVEKGETQMVSNPDCKLPADAVEVSRDAHAALLAAQGDGKVIQPGPDGRPVAADPPPPSPAGLEERCDAILRKTAYRIAEDEPERDAWLAYRKQLRALDLSDPASVTWPTPPA